MLTLSKPLRLISTLIGLAFSMAAICRPLNKVVIPVDDDIIIAIPIIRPTGTTIPGFDTHYITDYQYAQKYQLKLPDGSIHNIPKVVGTNGKQFVPYYQQTATCWDSGYLTQCNAGGPCKRQPRCIANVIQGDTLSVSGRLAIPGNRFLLPGEITPDGFALAPMESGLDRTFLQGQTTFNASWITYFPNNTSPSNFTFQTQTSYYANIPGEGGAGPHPVCAGTCFTVGTRSVVEVFGPLGPESKFNVYISGVNTSGNLLQDIADVSYAASYLNNPTDSNPLITSNLYNIQSFISANNLSRDLGIGYGHSLGAMCAAGLANGGWVSRAVLISPPYFVSSEALKSKPGVDITVYSGNFDRVSNGLNLNTNSTRITDGVNLMVGDTGNGIIFPHLLINYENTFPVLSATPF